MSADMIACIDDESPDSRSRGLERTFLENPTEWMQLMFGGGRSATGRVITPSAALQSSGIFAAARNIAEDLGSLPFILYRRLPRNGGSRDPRERADDHPLYSILHDEPNPEMDAGQFVETLQLWSELWPCAYAEIVRDGQGQVTALWPLMPDLVRALRVNGELVYHVTLPNGQTTEEGTNYKILERSLVFSVRGISLDAVSGMGLVSTIPEPIALALALEEYGARYFSGGAVPGGLLSVKGNLSEPAFQRMKAQFENRHKGLSNAHRLAILEEGTTWTQTHIQNDHAQFTDSRRFQLEEQARLVRIPPHKIGDLSKSTNNNIEHQGIEYTQDTIRPRAVRWERAVRRQLLSKDEKLTLYAEFLLDALLRGDAFSRAQTLQIKRQNGVINADDWRALDNENPLPDGQGQSYWMPANMIPVGGPPAPAAPTPPPDATPAAAPALPAGGADKATARASVLPPLRDALARMARRHVKAIEQAARTCSDLKAFEAWAMTYTGQQRADLASAIVPALSGLAILVGACPAAAPPGTAEALAGIVAGDLAGAYCARLFNACGDAAMGAPDYRRNLAELAASWPSAVAEVADELLERSEKAFSARALPSPAA